MSKKKSKSRVIMKSITMRRRTKSKVIMKNIIIRNTTTTTTTIAKHQKRKSQVHD
jgi:hypothetical protein